MVNLTIPQWNCVNHVKIMGITPEILSTLNPFVAIALTSKKGITLFPFSDILKPVHGYFFLEDIFCTYINFFGIYPLPANTFLMV